jgi:hypothetical protein
VPFRASERESCSEKTNVRSLLFLVLCLPAVAAAADCKFTAQRDFDVDAAALKTVAFDLGSTDVKVEGVPNLAKVEVRGIACASDQAWLAGLTVDQHLDGDRVTITPRRAHDTNVSWFGSSYAYIQLHVRVPARLAIEIADSSGDASISDVVAANFEASSGDLEVHHVAGPLTLKVSSGDVTGEDLGSVDVHATSSGDIHLRDVRGDVTVARSGSGDLTFDNVGGAVSIGSVGSGDVGVSRVTGDVSVDSIGSGDVNVNAVGGKFTVRSKGSGDVAYRGEHGTVSVPRERD